VDRLLVTFFKLIFLLLSVNNLYILAQPTNIFLPNKIFFYQKKITMNVSEKEERKEDADKKRTFMLDVMFLNTFGLFRGHNKSQTQKNLSFLYGKRNSNN